MATSQVLERIRRELIDSGRDTRYRLGSYEFILNGMEFYLTSIGEKRHVTGQELSKGLLLFAQKQFGPLAHTVLYFWGINTTEDFGNIVYNMIDIGIMSKQPDDSIEHFHDVVDIQQFFDLQDSYIIDKDSIKRLKGA
jgi:uncharacterized repeat protein (TIGR04138 family)